MPLFLAGRGFYPAFHFIVYFHCQFARHRTLFCPELLLRGHPALLLICISFVISRAPALVPAEGYVSK
jgi:hypothetical protein